MPEHSWTSKASVSQLDLAREQVGAGEVRELTGTHRALGATVRT